MKNRFGAALAAVLGYALVSTSGAWADTAVKIGSSVRAVFSLPLYVADQKGYFKDEGLDAEVVFFNGGPQATAALLGGSVQIISSAFENAMKVVQQGQPLVNVMAMQADFSGALVVRKDLAEKLGRRPRIDDLRGLRIGTLVRGGFADIAARYLLLDAKIDPDKDTTLIPIRGFDKHIAAGKAGHIDASLMVEPWQTIAVHETGDWEYMYNITIGEGPDIFHGLGYVTLQTSREYLTEHRNVVEKAVRALVRAQSFIAKEENLEASTDIAAKVFPNVKRETLRISVKNQLRTFRPALTQEMIDKTVELLSINGDTGIAPPAYEQLMDRSFAGLWGEYRP